MGHMGMHDIGHGYFPAQFRLFLEICEVEEMAVAGMVDGILYRLKILWSVVPAEMVLRTDFHAPAVADLSIFPVAFNDDVKSLGWHFTACTPGTEVYTDSPGTYDCGKVDKSQHALAVAFNLFCGRGPGYIGAVDAEVGYNQSQFIERFFYSFGGFFIEQGFGYETAPDVNRIDPVTVFYHFHKVKISVRPPREVRK